MTEDKFKVLSGFDAETRKYVMYMCSKGCKYYKDKCTKERIVRECARKGLKNKEEQNSIK